MGELIFDIGMHNGDDTRYYLANGYRVVAVDANPSLCDAARKRFAKEISTGQLSILNVGIAETEGEEDFWVSSTTECSSFDHSMATRENKRADCIKVKTIPFRRLLEEEGTPYFLKIDIEGSDGLCINDLALTESRPPYLSFESSHHYALSDISILEGLGYKSFKCVRQNDFRQITPENVIFQQVVRRYMKMTVGRIPTNTEIGRILSTALYRTHYRRRSFNGRKAKRWTSGPPGFELPGRWLTSDEILVVWHHLVAYDLALHANSSGEWFDIHAAYERPHSQPDSR